MFYSYPMFFEVNTCSGTPADNVDSLSYDNVILTIPLPYAASIFVIGLSHLCFRGLAGSCCQLQFFDMRILLLVERPRC
jgi:hypothetical protein